MRYRDYKIFRPNQYYHIYNRGNNKKPIFIDDHDYTRFLNALKIILNMSDFLGSPSVSQYKSKIRPIAKDAFSIISYCLMPNHFHFAIKQNTELPISSLILKLCTSYARYFNLKHESVGNLFQDTFKAKIVENDEYLKYLTAYIHNNPKNPATYKYSSYQEYAKNMKKICDPSVVLNQFTSKEDYISFVNTFKPEDHPNLSDI